MMFTLPMLLAGLAMLVMVFGFLAAVVAGVAVWIVGPRHWTAAVIPSFVTFAALVVGLGRPLGSGILPWLVFGMLVALGAATAQRIFIAAFTRGRRVLGG
jgi:hypothetical protein